MSKMSFIGNGLFYTGLTALIADTAKRAFTGEGFVEYLGPDGMQALEYLGLVQQKAATALSEFSQHLDKVGHEHLEALLNSVGPTEENVAAFEASTQEFIRYLDNRAQELRQVSTTAGYVADQAKNAMVALAAFSAGALKLYFDRRKKTKTSHNKKPEITLENRLQELAGVYVTSNLDSQYLYFEGETYSPTSDSAVARDVSGALGSFERSIQGGQVNLDLSLSETANICYIVPGGNDFKLEVTGKTLHGKIEGGDSSFYLGLKEIKFDTPGIHEIKLTIGQREYSATVTVKNPQA